MEPTREKTCTKCGESLPVTDFCKDRSTPDGLKRSCRQCSSAQYRRWYSENADRKRAHTKTWREDNIVARREYQRRYDKARASARRAYAQARADTIRQQNRERYAANPEKYGSPRQRRWRSENRDKHLPLHRLRQANRRARQLATYTVPFTAEHLAARWAYYGGRCWICRAPATETDHVKPLTAGGAHMLCNLRPACKPCNASKGGKWPYARAESERRLLVVDRTTA